MLLLDNDLEMEIFELLTQMTSQPTWSTWALSSICPLRSRHVAVCTTLGLWMVSGQNASLWSEMLPHAHRRASWSQGKEKSG